MWRWAATWMIATGCHYVFDLEPPIMNDGGPIDSVDARAATVRAVGAGGEHTCAVRDSDGAVRCWGKGESGRLGSTNTLDVGDDERPLDANQVVVTDVVSLAMGGAHVCALESGGGVWCWGKNDQGQLGLGSMDDVGDNETVASQGQVPLPLGVRQVVAGDEHTCALLNNRQVKCWGSGANGRLGTMSTVSVGGMPGPIPSAVIPMDVESLVAGSAHTCALRSAGILTCWGRGQEGQLGLGTNFDVGDGEPPATVTVPAVAAVAAGASHTCAVSGVDRREVRCWGNGAEGRLGYGDEVSTNLPSAVMTFPEVVEEIVAGGAHTCVRFPSGGVRCWGGGADGQLGYGDPSNLGATPDRRAVDIPALVLPGGTAIALTAGGAHTCSLDPSGQVYCWGHASAGQLGYGDKNNRGDTAPISTLSPVAIF